MRHHIAFIEDDGLFSRLRALVWLGLRHPLRVVREIPLRQDQSLAAIAPAVKRLKELRPAELIVRASADHHALAAHLGRLAGVPVRPHDFGYADSEGPPS